VPDTDQPQSVRTKRTRRRYVELGAAIPVLIAIATWIYGYVSDAQAKSNEQERLRFVFVTRSADLDGSGK